MNFILKALTTVLGVLFSSKGSTSNANSSTENTEKIEFSKPNNAIKDATAAIIWICAICLGIFWISQYLFADYMWIQDCLKHNKMMPFPLDTQRLFDMIYSFAGVGAAGAAHKIIRKLLK